MQTEAGLSPSPGILAANLYHDRHPLAFLLSSLSASGRPQHCRELVAEAGVACYHNQNGR